VLGVRHQVLRSEGNLNTETGLPLTLLRLEPGHTAAVLEMGMQGPGEIARLAALARPRVGIVTSIGTVHMEFCARQEELARAKAELLRALPPDGLAVINADDRFAPLLRELAAAPVVSFGLDSGDLRGHSYRPSAEGCELVVEGTRLRLSLPGRHQARNALAALAAYSLAFLLRFEFRLGPAERTLLASTAAWPGAAYLLSSYYFGLNRGLKFCAGVGELTDIVKAVAAAAALQAGAILASSPGGFPVSVLVAAPLMTAVAVAGRRLGLRLLDVEHEHDEHDEPHGTTTARAPHSRRRGAQLR